MKINNFLYWLLIALPMAIFAIPANAQEKKPVKVACIGASITYGATIRDREQYAYPAQLQLMLGKNFVVSNYGVNTTTLLHKGNKPYFNTSQYKDALAAEPDIVLIDLGGNDSKLVNRIYLDEYEKDYDEMITAFASLRSHPRIILLTPIVSFHADTTGIWAPVLEKRIVPLVKKIAYDHQLEIANMYPLFIDKPQRLADKVHPDSIGAGMMADKISAIILQQRDTTYDILAAIDLQKKLSSFHGYQCADFELNGHNCKIVQPKQAATGHPWVWRARFWGHEPQADIALLELGFHIVYCDVVELYGNKESITRWNNYYTFLTRRGLHKKAVLEGMSRGGVYAYNWAAENPKKVACIYVDNPVLDLKSWPGGFGKRAVAKQDWEIFKKDYGYSSNEAAAQFKGSPIDKIAQIVKGGYPLLHVCADADEAVLIEENTLPFEQKVKALGGDITVIHKPGFKHHPHSLPDPAPIVNFILDAVYPQPDLPKVFTAAEEQARLMLTEIPKANAGKIELVSPRTLEKNALKMVASRDWTSGFFPGVLWFLYQYTGKQEWKAAAQTFTANLEKEKMNGGTHDMGFKVYCSYGNGYRLTKDPAYREVIIQAARTLATRFNPIIGSLRSWDHSRDKWGFPVIIDNMMNLELLFTATQLTGDSSFYQIAVAHANTTMKNHYRPDNSSYHVVDYDTITGKVVKKTTHQGYANESAWSRGQAWGLYGFTMCYRFTKDTRYRQQAEKIATYMLDHLNMLADGVPYWDYNAPNIPHEERDASAAAVLASGLLELSAYSKNAALYKIKAGRIIGSLTAHYRSPAGASKGFILLHSTGSRPSGSEVDVPLNYADYYYLESLLRWKKFMK